MAEPVLSLGIPTVVNKDWDTDSMMYLVCQWYIEGMLKIYAGRAVTTDERPRRQERGRCELLPSRRDMTALKPSKCIVLSR
jgi:hypothetical protein